MTVRTTSPFGARNGLALAPELTRWIDRTYDALPWSQGDVREHDDRAVIVLDVPGVRAEQITITTEDRVLTIKADREGRGATVRHYTIGSKYDLAEVQAQLELGVLTLTLRKAPEAQARQIPITVV